MVYIPPVKLPRAAIEEDLECQACSYNLRGLRMGGACPECGAPIGQAASPDADQRTHEVTGFWGRVLAALESRHTPGMSSSLTEAPLRYLGQLSLACRSMQGAIALTGLMLGCVLLAPVASIARGTMWSWCLGASLIPGLLWAFGVWVMVAPRQTRELSLERARKEWLASRWTARVTQLFTLLACAMASTTGVVDIMHTAGPPTSLPSEPLWIWATLGVGAVGLLGFAAVGLYASRLAEWGNDSGLSDRLRLASLAVFFAPPFIIFCAWVASTFGDPAAKFFAGIMGLVACLLPLAWLVQVVIATMQFISMSQWANVNAHTILDRDRRLLAKAAQARAKAERAAHEGGLPAQGAHDAPFAPPVTGDLPLADHVPSAIAQSRQVVRPKASAPKPVPPSRAREARAGGPPPL